MMAAVLGAYEIKDRKVWGFDSFQGLPPPDEARYPSDRGDQLHRFPQLAVSMEEVTETSGVSVFGATRCGWSRVGSRIPGGFAVSDWGLRGVRICYLFSA